MLVDSKLIILTTVCDLSHLEFFPQYFKKLLVKVINSITKTVNLM